MKIGIDARLYSESGVGRYIRNLIKGLIDIDSKNRYTLFYMLKDYKEIKKLLIECKFKEKVSFVQSDVKWHTLSEQWKFKKIIDGTLIDLMHFPYFSYPIFYKKPFVITIHDLIIDHFPTGKSSTLPFFMYKLKQFGYRAAISEAVKNAQKIIVPSNATKRELINHYGVNSTEVEVIYEGFDPSIKRNGKIEIISDNFALYVGNAYPHKDLPTLIKAFSQFTSKVDMDLICIGKDDYFYDNVKKIAPQNVHFLHGVDDSTLFEYYSRARFFVMPSLMEGFGLPILEAMSLSCPVICSSTPALEEIGSDAVLYFEAGNATDLSEKMTILLKDKKLVVDLIKKGKKRADDFSWRKCVRKTLDIYESSFGLRQGK